MNVNVGVVYGRADGGGWSGASVMKGGGGGVGGGKRVTVFLYIHVVC